ncbi:MAG: response regulator [Lachnospiraceae bacterium]|nr:response regulator [Lachnospiraceae bacterium]
MEIETGKKTKLIREPMPYGKVLIVEDVMVNIEIVKLLLKPYLINTEESESGFDAIEKLKNGKEYDIIFMDNFMPEMNGFETMLKIREMGYTRPIIALTANSCTNQAELFCENGFDDYISKPIDIRQLNDILIKYIRDKHLSP